MRDGKFKTTKRTEEAKDKKIGRKKWKKLNKVKKYRRNRKSLPNGDSLLTMTSKAVFGFAFNQSKFTRIQVIIL